jgi:hypothetical protein
MTICLKILQFTHEKMADKMKENPRPGVVRNTVGGVNLYKDIRIDYSSDQELVYHIQAHERQGLHQ